MLGFHVDSFYEVYQLVPAIRPSIIVVKLVGLKQRLTIACKNYLCAVCFLMEALSPGWECSHLWHCGPVSLSRIVCTYCGLHSWRLLVLTPLLWCWMTPGVHQFMRNPRLRPDWHVCSCQDIVFITMLRAVRFVASIKALMVWRCSPWPFGGSL